MLLSTLHDCKREEQKKNNAKKKYVQLNQRKEPTLRCRRCCLICRFLRGFYTQWHRHAQNNKQQWRQWQKFRDKNSGSLCIFLCCSFKYVFFCCAMIKPNTSPPNIHRFVRKKATKYLQELITSIRFDARRCQFSLSQSPFSQHHFYTLSELKKRKIIIIVIMINERQIDSCKQEIRMQCKHTTDSRLR